MNTSLQTVELASARQALITGQVVDAITGIGLKKFSLLLALRLPGTTEFQPLQCPLITSNAGYFAASGRAVEALPQQLDPDQNVDVRFRVTAAHFSDLETIVSVPASALTATASTAIVAGKEIDLLLIAAPVLHQPLALQPVAVGLQGVTIEDNDPAMPLSGVSIQVAEPMELPAVISDAQGRFRIRDLPVVPAVVLRIVRGGENILITHHIDYSSPINSRIISLNG